MVYKGKTIIVVIRSENYFKNFCNQINNHLKLFINYLYLKNKSMFGLLVLFY